jgi:hypothetical protein
MTLISNPFGAHRTVTTFVAGQDRDGEQLFQPTPVTEYRAAAAILRGQVCEWVAPTATVPLSAQPMATASSNLLYAGVALDNAEVGEVVKLVTHGHAIVRTGDVTTALGQYLVKPGTTAGLGTVSATAIDAATVSGTILGVVVGNDDGTFTPVFLNLF